jgi:nitrogen fixation NifU-like protein
MSDPADLYRAVLMDHARRPRRRGQLPPPARTADVSNALCGDRAIVSVAVVDGVVAAVACAGDGCAISVAAASLLAGAIAGGTVTAARALTASVRAAVAGDGGPPLEGELAALASVAAFPARRRCATLVCDALDEALG